MNWSKRAGSGSVIRTEKEMFTRFFFGAQTPGIALAGGPHETARSAPGGGINSH